MSRVHHDYAHRRSLHQTRRDRLLLGHVAHRAEQRPVRLKESPLWVRAVTGCGLGFAVGAALMWLLWLWVRVGGQ